MFLSADCVGCVASFRSSESSWHYGRGFTSAALRAMAVQEIELRVPMCCRKCEDKVEIELKKMEGKVHTSWSVYSLLS